MRPIGEDRRTDPGERLGNEYYPRFDDDDEWMNERFSGWPSMIRPRDMIECSIIAISATEKSQLAYWLFFSYLSVISLCAIEVIILIRE